MKNIFEIFSRKTVVQQEVENHLNKVETKTEPQNIEPVVQTNAAYLPFGGNASGTVYPIITRKFDGEKTSGELGSPINLLPDHISLRVRAFEQDLKSDIIKIITGRFFGYVVGNGLKLQSEPNQEVLEGEGIKIDLAKFKKTTENRFKVWSKSKRSDFANMRNIHWNAREGFRSSFLGGDFLTILRLDKKYNVTVQIIDGQQVQTPMFTNYEAEAKSRGNKIKHGIEIDKTGRHIAYYVVLDTDDITGKFERIEARNKSGLLMAYMVYGTIHRLDHVRGVPQISSILEKVEKLDRYTEASVGSAEERAKIVYAIEHNRFSTGENVLAQQLKESLNIGDSEDAYQQGSELAPKIAATTSKQTFNMPVGARLAALSSQIELNYDVFFKAVFNQICAAVGVPPEVALQMYNSNYSASRAAINAWEHVINLAREYFAEQYYKPIYEFWLHVEILKNKIDAKGYLQAFTEDNFMALESLSTCKWTGVKLPHIDPKKEAEAIRLVLGDQTTSLGTYEQATEKLGWGEWEENFKKYLEEKKIIPKPEIIEADANKPKSNKPVANVVK